MRKVVIPVFQPIVDISTGQISHYEALARARVGSTGHVKLIELGEHYGFIDLIDMAIMEHVFRLLRDNVGVRIAVNVSVVTIEQSCNDILALVFKNMDMVDRMIFEITETVEIHDLNLITRFVTAVRLLDAKVAIDDFGDGHFTLALVRDIRPDFLKLSSNLVADMKRTGGEIAYLRDLIMVHGGEIIAEQVDSQEKLEILRELRVGYAQGFYVGETVSRLPVVRLPLETATSSDKQKAVVG